MADEVLSQGMVRPGCWWKRDHYAPGYLDRQYQIAKSIHAYHYDLYSFEDRHDNFDERYAAITVYFRDTIAEARALWEAHPWTHVGLTTEWVTSDA